MRFAGDLGAWMYHVVLSPTSQLVCSDSCYGWSRGSRIVEDISHVTPLMSRSFELDLVERC
jgi:hypothetical protein